MNNHKSSLSIETILTIIFIVLKLVGVINWSWVLVFSPTLIVIALALINCIVKIQRKRKLKNKNILLFLL